MMLLGTDSKSTNTFGVLSGTDSRNTNTFGVLCGQSKKTLPTKNELLKFDFLN